jgi:hypothetical protein
MNSFASEDPATPLAPPSKTCTCPSCQIVRLNSSTDPGTAAFAVVATEQVAPMLVSGVAAQGTVTGKDVSLPVPVRLNGCVAGSPELYLSVILSVEVNRSSPV